MRLSWLNMVTVIYSTNASSINWEKEDVGLGKGDLFEWYALCKSVDKSLLCIQSRVSVVLSMCTLTLPSQNHPGPL